MKIAIEGNLKDALPGFYIQTFSLLFFPEDNIFGKNGQSKNHIKIYANKNENRVDILVEIWYNGKAASKTAKTDGGDPLVCAGRLFYGAASELTGIYPPWGMHTGIRPAKTAGEILEKNGFDERKTINILRDNYLMTEKKAALALETHKNGSLHRCGGPPPFTKGGEKKDFSLYISIPFCPTRCKYCSFVSFATPRLLKLIPEYIEKLLEEIGLIAEIVRGMRLKTIYIGGGTPTVLDEKQLEMILNSVKDNFDLGNLLEYTAECGRPDTITKEKLELLKSFGIDRVSVNPQTLNDGILEKIGRCHTAEDFFSAFEAAREAGIKNINTDCIIGLADESKSSMINTIETLADLKPENITIHSLCIKKSADIKAEKIYNADDKNLNETLEDIYDILKTAGYRPYYMYRQKYTAGNLENTGFCLEGRECLYNIYMMDELMTIFGVGAGAMTKIVKEGRIERIANYKYPYEYIERDFQINGENNQNKLKFLGESQ